MNPVKLLFKIMLVTFLFSGCSRTVWTEKSFNTDKASIDTISIILPQVEFSQKIGDKFETKGKQSIFVSTMVANMLKESIEAGNLLPKVIAMNYDSSLTDKWIPRYFSISLSKYKNVYDSLIFSKDGEKILPISPELKLLTDKVNTKYFVFAAGNSFIATDETKHFDFLQQQTFKMFYGNNYSYNYQWYGLQLHIFLVETKSMKIVWQNFNNSDDSKYDPAKPDDVKNLCQKLLVAK